MKNLLPLAIAIFVLGFLSSCTTTRTFSTTDGSYEGMEIYTVKSPEKDFEEIKFIHVQGAWPSGPKGMMDILVKRAKSEGANGLINVQYNRLHVGGSISGTAVKFENGIE